jgi:glutaminyl-tRNA synthetase
MNSVAFCAVSVPASVPKSTKFGILGSDAVTAEIRLYDRLFNTEHPDAGGKDLPCALNPNSLQTFTAYVEPGIASAKRDDKFQFERHGYFVADRVDHGKDGKAVFNRVTGLRESSIK